MKRTIWIGIDVAKDKLDVAVKKTEAGQRAAPTKRAQEAWISPNTDKGVAELVRRLASLEPDRIVMEATGGYEQRVFLALRASGLPAVIVPREWFAPSRMGSGAWPRPIGSMPWCWRTSPR